MKPEQFLPETTGTTLYHVTLTKNVPGIQAKGILPMQPTNWVQAGNKSRYGGGEIFAFEQFEDAIRWASKWDWDLHTAMGSGKISVITFETDISAWEVDTADPLTQSSSKGKWLKAKYTMVAPAQIKEVTPITAKIIRDQLMSKREDIDEEEEIIDEASYCDPRITTYLKEQGFKLIGNGIDCTVFSAPNGLVLKIFGTHRKAVGPKAGFSASQHMFFKWADFCQKNQANPFLPKFYGDVKSPFEWGDPPMTYLQIWQEPLKHSTESCFVAARMAIAVELDDALTVQEWIENFRKYYTGSWETRGLEQLIEACGMHGLELLWYTMIEIHSIGVKSGYDWDLHGNNFMLRADGTPVIVDPWTTADSVPQQSPL